MLFFRRCFPLCVLLMASLFAVAQQKPDEPENPFQEYPFDAWEKQGPVEQFPWKIQLANEGLTAHQRDAEAITIRIDGADIVHRSRDGRLIGFIKITDSRGNTFIDDGIIDIPKLSSETAKTYIELPWEAFVLPGEYKVELALYHTVTKEHSFAVKRLSVPGADETLRKEWSDLPSVEYFPPIPPSDLDYIYLPEMEGKLHLPVQTRQRLDVTVLADLTQSDVFFASRKAYESYLGRMLPAFKAFSQLDVKNGSLHLATLDLLKRKVTYETKPGQPVAWDGLKPILRAPDLELVSVATLQQKKHPSPIFLREELARRMTAATTAAPAPRQVYILLSSPLDLYDFPDLSSEPMTRCDCVVYLLVFPWAYQPQTVTGRNMVIYIGGGILSGAGKVKKMLAPVEVRTFTADTPDDVRKAMAKIMEDLSKM